MKEKYVVNSLQEITELESQLSTLSRIFRLTKTARKRTKMTKMSKDVRMERALEFMRKLQSRENKLKNGEK